MFYGWFASFLLVVFACFSKENKAHNLSLCAVFKNEAPYLKEWIEYHLLIGVDHFYLYDNGSCDGFEKELDPYVQKGIVSLIHWPDRLGPMANRDEVWALSTQVSAYENALKWRALGKTKWLLFLDIDEFLALPQIGSLQDILTQFDSFPGINLPCIYFDASFKSDALYKRLVVESFDITAPPPKKLSRAVQKTILKPDLCTSFVWPPYACSFKKGQKAASVKKHQMRIQQYTNRMKFLKIHRMKKLLPIDAKTIPDEEIQNYLQNGYEIKDPDLATYSILPDLYRKMGFGPRLFDAETPKNQ